MNTKVGDLVKLKAAGKDVVGMVVKVGVDHRRMYGDGVEIIYYADVQWFNEKYGKQLRRFSGTGLLEVISEA